MYSELPTLERRVVKASVIAGWANLALSGLGGSFFPGKSVITAIGPEWLSVTTSAITLVASLVAIAGVLLTRRAWWLEWVGAGFAGFGLVYYVAVPWWYLLNGDLGRMQQAGVVAAALFSFVSYRVIRGWLYARKLSRLHTADVLTGQVANAE